MSATEKSPVTVDGATLTVLPTPRQINLKTIDDVRLEMGKVYRDMRNGNIEMGDGTRLVYVLSQIGRVIQTGELTDRVAAVERVLRARRQ